MPRSVVYHYEGGIADFVRHINARSKTGPVHSNVIEYGAEDTDLGMSLEVAMQWNGDYTEGVHTFANTINTHEGGAHEEGFRTSLTSLVNRYARERWNLLKDKDPNLSGEDIREGLTAIVSHQAARTSVRGSDQDQARQHRGQDLRAEGHQRTAGRLVRRQPRRGQGDRTQVDQRRDRADRRAQGARPRAQPQGSARWRRPARQADRLLVEQPRRVRGLRRRG